MAIIKRKKTTRTIEQRMEESPFVFYLTGSKYFGTEYEGSDTDYFVQTGIVVEEFLRSLGFTLVDNSKYLDTLTEKVMSIRTGPRPQDKIDVQLVKNAMWKKVVQQYLIEVRIMYPMPALWNLCWKLLEWKEE